MRCRADAVRYPARSQLPAHLLTRPTLPQNRVESASGAEEGGSVAEVGDL
jgi:hypothetical protein